MRERQVQKLSGPSLKALGEERIQVKRAAGIGARALREGGEAGRAVERVRNPDKVGRDKSGAPET